MPDITYGVAVEYVSSGNLGSASSTGIDKATVSMQALHSAASKFNGVLDGVIGKIESVASSIASGIGAVMAGGIALATHESIRFNQEMEDTITGLATIANAQAGLNGFSTSSESFGNQYRLAGDVVKQMRKDAQELPGEFKDLQNMMALMSPAATNAGIGMFDTEKIAANSMAAAAALRVPFATAGREVGNIIAGTVTGRMPMFSKMGLGDAKDWNKLSQEERVLRFRAKLSDMAPGLESVKKNWSTVSSNFIDNLKIGVGLVGGPLLDRIKGVLDTFNKSDKTGFASLGSRIGEGLVKAFDAGEAAILKWFPIIENFMGVMHRGFERVFGGLSSLVDILLPRIESFLKDPAAFSKIESVLGSLVALRMGGGVLEAGAGIAPGLLSAVSAMAGGGAAGGTVAGAVAVPIAEALGVAALAVYGFTKALTDSQSSMHEAATGTAKTLTVSTSKLVNELTKSSGIFNQTVELGGVAAARWLDWTVAGLGEVAKVVNDFSSAISFAAGLLWGVKPLNPVTPDDIKAWGKQNDDFRVDEMIGNLNPIKAMNGGGAEEPTKPVVPNHTTHIHHVEIKVNSNQDPNRIAKAINGILRSRALANTPAGQWAGNRE